MLKMKLTTMMAVSVMASACATQTVPNDTFSQGWRRAQVLAVNTDQLAVQSDKQDCRKALVSNAVDTKFVLISYTYGGSPNLKAKRIVSLPNDVEVKVGDRVFVNVRDCKLALSKFGLLNERP